MQPHPADGRRSATQDGSVTALLLAHRYFILCTILAVLMVLHTLNGQWGNDFWEHAAAVRELTAHPFSPGHPQLPTDDPHAFYGPYTLAVALLARATGTDAIHALMVMAMPNLILILLAFRAFVTAVTGRPAAAFYALLFTLLLWGAGAWEYSGFFHIKVIGRVLSYPSTFAMGLTFLGLAAQARYLAERRLWRLVAILALSVLVLLTHPICFIALSVGLLALAFGGPGHRVLRDMALSAGILTATVLLALFWPHYPLWDLLGGASSVFHESNREMYQGVLRGLWPSLIGVPALLWRLRRNARDPLTLMAAGLAVVYLYGGLSANYSYGRVVAVMVLCLHVALADLLAQVEERHPRLKAEPAATLGLSCVVALGLVALSATDMVGPCLKRCRPGLTARDVPYRFLARFVGPTDTVLSDAETSRVVPAIAGKVVRPANALAFVGDLDEHEADVDRFFLPSTSLDDRMEVVRKHNVRFVLFNKSRTPAWAVIAESLRDHATPVYVDQRFLLLKVRVEP